LEDKLIFAENQRRNNLITEDEYLKYERYFDEHTQGLTHLDVLIYLSADVSVLAERIRHRNRKMEKSIDIAYLS
jgi:deoxyadenosine/deoxycytidine kinase